MWRRMREALQEENGSILPLAIGYVVLAAALVAVTVDCTSLYITQKRADALADAAAAAGADAFTFVVTPEGPLASLDDGAVYAQALAIIDATAHDAAVVSATSPDGTSARVTVALAWHPPLLSVFVPDGWDLQATATARTALN